MTVAHLVDASPRVAAARRRAVRAAFRHAWRGYTHGAFGHDEVHPVTNRTNDSWGRFGVVLVGVGIWHMIYVAATRRGREELRAIAPARADLAHFVNHMRFHLWSRRGHVEFGRYDYTFFGQLKENTNVYARLRYSF